MAFTVHPIGSNSGFSEESPLDSELHRLLHGFGDRMADFIISPFNNGHFDITTSGSSYDVDIAAGDGMFGGHYVQSNAIETVTVDASTTNEIFIVVADAKTGNAAIEYTSDGSTPSGQYVMKIWDVTTDGSGVTGTTDQRQYIPFPEDVVDESITGFKTGSSGTIAVDSTGVKTVSVTFTNPYRDRIDTATAVLNELSDTTAEFGWIRTTNLTVDGFDIEAKVTVKGTGGSTASFDYQANGK